MSENTPALRLALRVEGHWWNAYVAPMDTMKGAFLIGAIPIASAKASNEIKNDFMALMRKVMEAGLPGGIPEWNSPTRAPESERSGHG